MPVHSPPVPPGRTAGAAPFVPGGGASVPPPSIPLGFLAAGGVGLTALGLALWFAADRIVSAPTHPGALSAVHVGMLAFLLSILSALPIPFGHMVPALALMVIGLGLIEHDGAAILLGTAVGVMGILVFGLVLFGLTRGINHFL